MTTVTATNIQSSADPIFIYIDLFCGAGGTTQGIVQARRKGNKIAIVAGCVNHDKNAIKSHWSNHPEVEHFEEDIRTLELSKLIRLVNIYRAFYPNARIVLWASLECTNFSKAKGGLPRDADSRTLADHLYRYVHAIDPDYIQIENVVEFMAWGPLDEKGKPISRKNGCDFVRWKDTIDSFGYHNEWKVMDSADYGAYTSRKRLFGCFAKKGLPIIWPAPTHAKVKDAAKPKRTNKGKKKVSYQPDLFSVSTLKPWKPVKDVLELDKHGQSIFNRKKPLSPNTLKRIYAGLIKFVAGGEKSFMAKTYAVASNSDGVYSIEGPAHTITTRSAKQIVSVDFLSTYNGGNDEHRNSSLDNPCKVLTTQNAHALVSAFLSKYHGNGYNSDIDNPSPTIATKDQLALINAQYIVRDFNNGGGIRSVDDPSGALMTVPKISLVTACQFLLHTHFGNNPTSLDAPSPVITANGKWAYLVNPSWFGNNHSIEDPSPVIVASQHKAPLYVVVAEEGNIAMPIFEDDCEETIKIKCFMVVYGIADIKMRMLFISELIKIQGFPSDYKLIGTQKDQKKFIGNSVHPLVPQHWIEAFYDYFETEYQKGIAA